MVRGERGEVGGNPEAGDADLYTEGFYTHCRDTLEKDIER